MYLEEVTGHENCLDKEKQIEQQNKDSLLQM